MTTIEVFVQKATNLAGEGLAGKADPYVYIKLDGQDPQQTSTVNNDSNPEWNETLTFEGVEDPASKELDISIWDDDTFKDDKMARFTLDLGTLMWTDEPQQFNIKVVDGYFSDSFLEFTVKLDGSWGNCPPEGNGDLDVEICACTGLDDSDYAGTTDPYCYLQIDGCDPQQTSKKEGTVNPEWNEVLTFEGIEKPLSKTLKITIYDDDTWSRDDKIGYCEVDLAELIANADTREYEKTVDTMLFGLMKQASLTFKLTNKGWGNSPA